MKLSNQPLQKHQSRSADSVNRRSKESMLKRRDPRDPVKKPQNVVKKSLDSAFLDVSGDRTPETIDSSPESDVIDEHWLSESIISASSEISGPYDFASLLDVIEDKQEGEITEELQGFGELDSVKSIDIVQKAPIPVSKTSDINLEPKVILEALIKELLTEQFFILPQDKDQFTDLASEKVRIGSLCFFLWMIITVSIVFILKFGSQGSTFCQPPT